MFACFSPLSLVGKKKQHSKGFSTAAERSKKICNRRRRRVIKNTIDFVSTSSDVVTIETISRSFPKAPSMEEAESTRYVIYEGGDEQGFEIESLKGDCYYKPEGELVFHDGTNNDSNKCVSEKQTMIDNEIEGETILEFEQNPCVTLSSGRPSTDRNINWVHRLEDCSFSHVVTEDYCDKIQDGSEMEDESSSKNLSPSGRSLAEEEMGHACYNIIQSFNSFSTDAYISSIGLKLIPSMAAFVCLRSINLSSNCISEITPGSLPKSLHTLDLSHNKISTVEGLRGLERLRILNLSYNRISRIGHGLSSCALIKELYLAGNKISYVEGLHRILKLKVLDMSFNKITTAKGLEQLVANYDSLLALNLTGNPMQANIGNDQLQKEVQGFLPHLSYLNKLPIKPLKIREVATKCVAKAAAGDGARRSPQRKMARRLSGIGSSALSITRPGGNLRKASLKATSFRAIKHRSKSGLSTPARIDQARRSISMVTVV